MKFHYVVELIDEDDELVGYGVCVIEIDSLLDPDPEYSMLPDVHGTRSQAHHAIDTAEKALS